MGCAGFLVSSRLPPPPRRPRAPPAAHRYLKLWDLHDGAGAAALDRDTFTDQVLSTLRLRHRAFLASLNALCCALFDLADTDGDDRISEREYRLLLHTAFGLVSPLDLQSAYRMLDRDGSGTLEHNEIHEAVIEYFTSTDPAAPGNWLLGPPPPSLTGSSSTARRVRLRSSSASWRPTVTALSSRNEGPGTHAPGLS